MKKWFSFGIGMIVLGIITTLIFPCTVMAAKEIKIGVIYPLTGGAAAAGRELKAGAELAAEIANSAMPEIDMTMARLRLAEQNGLSLDAYRFDTLDYFYALAGRARITEAA